METRKRTRNLEEEEEEEQKQKKKGKEGVKEGKADDPKEATVPPKQTSLAPATEEGAEPDLTTNERKKLEILSPSLEVPGRGDRDQKKGRGTNVQTQPTSRPRSQSRRPPRRLHYPERL